MVNVKKISQLQGWKHPIASVQTVWWINYPANCDLLHRNLNSINCPSSLIVDNSIWQTMSYIQRWSPFVIVVRNSENHHCVGIRPLKRQWCKVIRIYSAFVVIQPARISTEKLYLPLDYSQYNKYFINFSDIIVRHWSLSIYYFYCYPNTASTANHYWKTILPLSIMKVFIVKLFEVKNI